METYYVAGIDVHKRMLAVVVTNAAREGAFVFERQKFGTMDSDLQELRAWLKERGVREVVMESTAQYWKPVWRALEADFELHLAQAQSNRAPKGRKSDFKDAERLVRRHVADELITSFVPGPEQRAWRTLSRSRDQLTQERVRLQAQMEALLEDCRIKLTSCVSDSLGLSSRNMLRALAAGERDPGEIAKLAEPELRATQEQLRNALSAARDMPATQRTILKWTLERLDLIERQRDELSQVLAAALKPYEDAVMRLAEVPGFGIVSAQQVIVEVGPRAATFRSARALASWVGVCPGQEESAEVSSSNRSPKGNRQMRRVLTQVANAAVRTKGTVFHAMCNRLLHKGRNVALWAVAHKLCRVAWSILYHGTRYEERGQILNAKAAEKRKKKLTRQLEKLGFQVTLTPVVALEV